MLNERVSDSAWVQSTLAELTHKEQMAHAAMREASRRKQELLQQMEEQAKLNAQAKRQELATKVAEMKEVDVLNIRYSKLRTRMKNNGLRVTTVHPDILKLLRAALPAVDEEQFYQLVTVLLENLVYQNAQAKEAVSAMRADERYARYFEESQEFVGLPLVLTGRYAGGKRELLSEFLTAYALEWGKATEYEEKE